jgi:hypothetical protein
MVRQISYGWDHVVEESISLLGRQIVVMEYRKGSGQFISSKDVPLIA